MSNQPPSNYQRIKNVIRQGDALKLLAGPFCFFLVLLFFPTSEFSAYPLMTPALALASWMIVWWILEPMPIYVTAFLPLLLGENLGLGKTADFASSYASEMTFLFLGGFILARAIEKFDIHRNIAAMIIKRTGTSPFGVLLGFIIATAFLSMWLSNTGTAIMMMPMAMTVLSPLPEGKLKNQFSFALLLSIAYSANIGGMATLIGSPTNVMMAGILKESYQIEVDFASWAAFGFPLVLVLLALLYLYFKKIVIRKSDEASIQVGEVQNWTGNQKRVLLVFACTVIFWIFKPLINDLTGFPLSDAQIAVLAMFFLFVIPKEKSKEYLLSWNDTKETPWGILFLFGGGLALAQVLSNGGVLDYFASSISSGDNNNLMWLLLILIVSSVFLTELISNMALVSVLVPVVAKIAVELNIDVLVLCMPITFAASCAFMLPMATPPNAIVFASEKIQVKQMVRAGFVLNIISIIVIFATFAGYNWLKG